MTELSIIIVNWNTRDHLQRCLFSLQRTLGDMDHEIVVVDNGSDDGSAALVQAFYPAVRLIQNQVNIGFARANNQGMQECKGEFIALLNSDTEAHHGSLQQLLMFLRSHPQAGACGPRLLNSDGSLQPSCHPMLTPERELWRWLWLDRFWPRSSYPLERWDTTTPRQVEVLKGACIVLRRQALDNRGPLDEAYFMYTEEVDLCHRLAQAGWQIWWVPQAVITHHGGASSRQAAEAMYLELHRSKMIFFRKWGNTQAASRYRKYLRLVLGPRLLLSAAFTPFSEKLRERRRCWVMLWKALPSL